METSDILKIKTPDRNFFPFDSWNEKQRLVNFSSRNHLLLHKVNGFTENEKLWHFHPIAFVQHLKRLFDGDTSITKEQLKAIVPEITDANLNKYIGPLNETLTNYEIISRLEQAHFIAQIAAESDYFAATKEYGMKRWDNPDWYFLAYDPEPEKELENLDDTTTPTLDEFLSKMSAVYSPTFSTVESFTNWANPRALSNGNSEHGDGIAFCGKGLIHVTWKTNYEEYAKYRQKKYGESGTIDRAYLKSLGTKMKDDPKYAADSAGWFWRIYKNTYRDFEKNATVKRFTLLVNGGYNGIDTRKKVFKKAYEVFSLEAKHGRVDKWLEDKFYAS
ncbi:hypothetical protein KKA14_01520 [bacterium]|nr:hypothetical protein [bacterium]